MKRRDEDLAFLEFCRTGRPEHLARVFDLTAPGLLLIACHLAHGAEEVEDLVQATFAAAIESAPRFDRSQPVFRWLAGILSNQAREARRRAQRQVDPERVRTTEPPGPAALAAEHELTETVGRALEELPEHYRSVLVLRLLHGLEPVAIAHALGRPPETVRTQLARGLEKLRAALPQGLALAAAFLEEARGLDRVRAAVLAKVPATVPVLGVSAAALLAAPKAWMTAGCALALVAVTAWWVAGGQLAGPTTDDAPGVVTAAASRQVETRSTAAAGEPRQPVTGGDQGGTPPTTHRRTLTGRCVAAESGEPLAGSVVELTTSARGLTLPGAVTTRSDGLFRFEVPTPAFSLSIRHAERVELRARLLGDTAATKLDLGDVRMLPGVRVRGQCADEQGAPVGGTAITTALGPVAVGTLRGEPQFLRGTVAANGEFELGVLPVGQHTLRSDNAELMIVSPRELTVAADPRLLDVRVVLRRAGVLSGVVVDPDGIPMRGIQVSVVLEQGGQQSTPITNQRGEFTVHQVGDGPTAQLCFVDRHSRPMTPLSVRPGDGPIPWGTKDIRVVLPAPATDGAARLRVVDAETGAAVEEFDHRCRPDPTWRRSVSKGPLHRPRNSARHEQGIVKLTRLEAPDRYLAFVTPASERYVPSGPVAFEARPDQETEVVIRLRRGVDFRVQVVRSDGSPVAKGQVELLHVLGKPAVTQDTRTLPLEEPPGNTFSFSSAGTQAVIRAEATTAEDGTAVLRAPAGDSGLALRVRPIECLGRVVHDVAIPPSQEEPLRIVVESACVLEGRVTPADLVARLAAVAEERAGLALTSDAGADWRRMPLGPPYWHAVGADGRFRISGVPPGTWSVHLYCQMPMVVGSSSAQVFVPPLATVTLDAGQTLQLELDARAFTPATVRGRLFEDGRPLAHSKWVLVSLETPNFFYRVGGAPTDKDGWFTAGAVLPGRYCLFATAAEPHHGLDKARQAQQLLRVLPGDALEQVFTITPTTVVVRLTHADGTTAASKRTLRWASRQGASGYGGEAVTNDQGIARLDPARFLPGEFYLREPEMDDAEFMKLSEGEQQARILRLGTVEPVPGQSEIQVHFRLPAR